MTLDNLIERFRFLSIWLGIIQSKLDFDDWRSSPQFATPRGLGRVALLACLLGILWGINGTFVVMLSLNHNFPPAEGTIRSIPAVLLSEERISMLWRWFFYGWAMCTFHLMEFFTTAVYNPTVTSANSYLVNHSKAYTAAFLIAAAEFWIKFLFFPSFNSAFLGGIAILIVLISQAIRSAAMITCGESFNHLIQTSKKDNHILITHGIYRYLRHPSYVGFYYWSVGTQLVLGNHITAVLFGAASWMFFRRRIPYEEESLLQHFPKSYPLYAQSTIVGIPFVSSHGWKELVLEESMPEEDEQQTKDENDKNK